MTTTLHIKGMHCNSCKVLIEDICGDIQGIRSCSVNVNEGTAAITHDNSLDIEKVKEEIKKLGDYSIA